MNFKITKYVHACLLVETEDRVALFDPGTFSSPHMDINNISKLDDIFITHIHGDHFDKDFIKKLAEKFPEVKIISTPEVIETLKAEGVTASAAPIDGVVFFDSPHETVEPLLPTQPQEIGIHYLDSLSHPGDSHSFTETKDILALPMTAPWGATVKALSLTLELKPKYVLPIHDWHWNEEAREGMYKNLESFLGDKGIKFFPMKNGEPIDISI